MFEYEDFDIIGNMKIVDNYKNFLLSSVADLFSTVGKGSRMDTDVVLDELSEIVILAYLLGKRFGINYSSIDERVVKKLKIGVLEENGIEKEYQDYSKLIAFFKDRREE
jgi:hypothetical protein